MPGNKEGSNSTVSGQSHGIAFTDEALALLAFRKTRVKQGFVMAQWCGLLTFESTCALGEEMDRCKACGSSPPCHRPLHPETLQKVALRGDCGPPPSVRVGPAFKVLSTEASSDRGRYIDGALPPTLPGDPAPAGHGWHGAGRCCPSLFGSGGTGSWRSQRKRNEKVEQERRGAEESSSREVKKRTHGGAGPTLPTKVWLYRPS
ncbi:hypothetical protein NFI96_002712 [Prochilodus magdalenae]|nr:hypothetical protein NFI96_002712 [Prochilodus magdalenae]